MLKGRWLFILAFGGLAHAQDGPVVLYNDAVLVCDETGCRQRSGQEKNGADNTEPHDDSAAEKSDVPSQIIFESFRSDPPAANSPTEEETQREKDDLKAQQDMADWAFGMLVATIIGVGLIALTLRETRRAAIFAADTLSETTRLGNLQLTEAKNATVAANKTVDVTQKMGQAQSRAYLTISDSQFKFFPDSTHPAIKLTVLNSGHTPAKHVSVVFGVNYEPDGQPIPHSEIRVRQLTDFGGGEDREIELEMEWAPMPEGYFEKWMKGEEVPVFEGWFQFRDVFKKPWKAPFQFEAFFDAFDGDWNYSPLYVPAWRFPLLSDGENQ